MSDDKNEEGSSLAYFPGLASVLFVDLVQPMDGCGIDRSDCERYSNIKELVIKRRVNVEGSR